MPNDDDQTQTDSGGFVALAAIAAAAGAGAVLLLAPSSGFRARRQVGQGLRDIGGGAARTIADLQQQIQRRKRSSRREKRLFAVAGFLVGAGLTALLTPESGPATRKLLGRTIGRIKVGAVDRIERLGQAGAPAPDEQPVRNVQELGRDSSDVF